MTLRQFFFFFIFDINYCIVTVCIYNNQTNPTDVEKKKKNHYRVKTRFNDEILTGNLLSAIKRSLCFNNIFGRRKLVARGSDL